MNCTLTLYKNCAILPQKLFMVDDIEEYLSTLEHITDENYQYQRLEEIKELKINANQFLQEPNAINNYNYAKVQNDGGSPIYYFVGNKVQRAKETIRLEAYIDTINTFTPGKDFQISKKTHIHRMHKDRLIGTNQTTITGGSATVHTTEVYQDRYYGKTEIDLPAQRYIFRVQADIVTEVQHTRNLVTTIDTNRRKIIFEVFDDRNEDVPITYFVRRYTEVRNIIDYFNEGITPLLYKKNSKKLVDASNQNWYLLYQNRNQIETSDDTIVNPVDCYIVPEIPGTIKTSTGEIEITSAELTDNYTYFDWHLSEYTSFSVMFVGYDENDNWVIHQPMQPQYEDNGILNLQVVMLQKTETADIIATTMTVYLNPNTGETGIYNNDRKTIRKAVFRNANIDYKAYESPIPLTASQLTPELTPNKVFSGTDVTADLIGIDSIDRTDARLIKIIELPYCPLDIQDGVVTGVFEVLQNKIHLLNYKQKFGIRKEFDNTSIISPLLPYNKSIITTALKSVDNENKLYHSDFYTNQFVYDAFSISFALERIDYDAIKLMASDKLLVDYYVTSTINSRFAFIFPQYYTFISTSNFDNVLTVARNNELPLYNSAYINYIRTGYNYDVKNKEITKTNSTLNAIGSTVGAVASIGLAVFTKSPYSISMAATAATSAISSIITSVNTVAASEVSFEAKQKQYLNQTISVAGSDDVDIMEAYSGNRAYFNTYAVSDRLKEALFDLFFYAGYATDEHGVPNLNTRTRFNFISCDLIIKETNNLPDYVILDLINKYKSLTVIHHFEGTWDFEQEYENWESSLGGII